MSLALIYRVLILICIKHRTAIQYQIGFFLHKISGCPWTSFVDQADLKLTETPLAQFLKSGDKDMCHHAFILCKTYNIA